MATLLSIPIDQIIIPEYRQRTTPLDREKIAEFAESFSVRGKQINPIALRKNDEDKWVLVAGFRRLCTRKLVPNVELRCGELLLRPGCIAATNWGDLTVIEQNEIELEENAIRADLTVAEKAAAVGLLHDLRKRQAEAEGKVYTNFALANDARVAPESPRVSERVAEAATLLELSKHVAKPEVAKIKTIPEARAFLRKEMSRERNADLRKAYEANVASSASPHRIILGSCYDAEVWKRMPFGQFDVACFDPPYGVNAQAFGSQGGQAHTAGHKYEDSKAVWDEVCSLVPSIAAAALKEDCHLYSFCDPRNYVQLAEAMEAAGFTVWHVPLIWAKNGGILPDHKRGPRRTYEVILYAYRGQKEVERVAPDVLSHAAVHMPRHGAEKPVSLLIDILSRSVRPGSLVLDLFAGSGSIFPAASSTHCVAWGIEREQAHYDLAVTRLTEVYSAPGAQPRASGGEAPAAAEQANFSLETLA